MLKKYYNVLVLLGILSILLLFRCYDKCFFLDKSYVFFSTKKSTRFRWPFYDGVSIEEQEEFKVFTLPNIENESTSVNLSRRPWFTVKGLLKPKKSSSDSSSSLFPDATRPYDDRIPQQLTYIPKSYGPESKHKIVLLHDYIGKWISHDEGSSAFENCPVNRCTLTMKKERFEEANAVLFDVKFRLPKFTKANGQVWIIYMLESPANTRSLKPANMFNWTMTYRPDSDIPIPYARWFYHGPAHRKVKPLRNFAANKTMKVAWFVSNCYAQNLRDQYAKELTKHIQVDIFGKCGEIDCPRQNEEYCFKYLAKNYKFYLAFENSNCNYYITEKYYKNALRHNVIPIVMGARRGDYEHLGPKGSFIHINDFQSPEALAQYLHKLDKDDELYNQYFLWRGTGEFIQHHFYCRLCALLHSNFPAKHYEDINRWWRANHACSTDY